MDENKEVVEVTPKTKKTKNKKINDNNEEVINITANDEVLSEMVLEPVALKNKRLKKERAEAKKISKAKEKMIKRHQQGLKKKNQTILRYETDVNQGLSQEAVEKRTIDALVNKTNNKKSKSIGRIIVSNVFTFFNILTFLIAGCLIYVGAFTDLVFLVIVCANISIGIIQEIRAKKTIDKLSLLSAPTALVIRAGNQEEIKVEDVVLDDLILLETGKQICADSIVLEGSIEVNESMLTGESDAIIKNPGDQLYSGSFVVSGKCKARVDKVGKDNYIEQLTNQAKKYKKPKSDLLKSLNWIIYVMAVVIVIMGSFLFYIQYFKNGLDLTFAVRKTAGAMIGMIPSGLFLMTSIALMVGVIRLADRNVMVQELYCIEMLARVNCICLDKTGTITDGTMSVKNVIDYNSVHSLTTKNIISGILNASEDTNLTSVALAEKFGTAKRFKTLATIPFSSSRKYQAVTFDKYGTFILGAPEFVLKDKFELVKTDVNKYAAMGYRVLCLAHRDGIIENNNLPNTKVEIISLILIEDNIRPDAINTIKYFRDSGVSVRVISGDNPITVSKISQRAGIERAEDYISLDGLTDQEVIKAASKYTVFGRVSPAQKKLLIKTLKAEGLTVAMTGDGVNDILALKEADCSIAVASGSEAARNVSHLVLMDSNFDSMPKVVAEGRRVINNVTSVAALFLTKTIFSLLLAIQALQTGVYPISTNQLIIIDFFCIGFPSFFLVYEPNNNTAQGKFLFNVLKKALPGALVILLISLLTFALSDEMQLDAISYSTIIVIAATHTCMMVLFKTCKPFNTLRKVICTISYTAFLFAVTIIPYWLEFRPIASVFEYYSNNITTEMITNYPTIEVSKDSYYVIDGKVTSYYRSPSEKASNITATLMGDNYYYKINETVTDTMVRIPYQSFDEEGYINVLGYRIDSVVLNSEELIYDELGYLYIYNELQNTKKPAYITLTKKDDNYNYYPLYGDTTPKTVHASVLPNIVIKDGEIILDNVTSKDYKYKTTLSSLEDVDITINLETNELLVNGDTIYPTYTDGSVGETYKVSMPKLSKDISGHVYLNSSSTGIHITNLYGGIYKNGVEITDYANFKYGVIEYQDADGNYIYFNKIYVVPGESNYYISAKDNLYKTSISLSNKEICPEITITESGNYIISGYYTKYKATTGNLDPIMNSDHYLMLGGQVTNYKISSNDIIVQNGGMVEPLSLTGLIFLLALCLISSPLMKLLNGLIPWIRKQVLLIKNRIVK